MLAFLDPLLCLRFAGAQLMSAGPLDNFVVVLEWVATIKNIEIVEYNFSEHSASRITPIILLNEFHVFRYPYFS